MSTMEEDFRKMNSDGYDEQYEKYCRGIEYEMSKEPKFYPNDGKLPITNCNITMSEIKYGDKICDTCCKEDVCMYKGELVQAANEIIRISESKNIFIDTDIRCKKWSGKVSNYR